MSRRSDGELQLTPPTVHLNGTSQQELRDQYEHAYRAVKDAIDAVAQSAPNQRDYYVQPNAGAFARACDEHVERLQHLERVRDELMALFIAVDEQGANRRRSSEPHVVGTELANDTNDPAGRMHKKGE